MNNLLHKIVSRNWRPGRAAWVGLVATIVYSIVMEGDKAIIGNRFSDTRFIQGLLEGTRRSRGFFLLSWFIHLLNGVALAEIYGAIARRFLPGRTGSKAQFWRDLYYRRMVAYSDCRQISSSY